MAGTGGRYPSGGGKKKLTAEDADDGKNDSQSDETAADAVVIDEILTEATDVDCRTTVTRDHRSGDQTTLVGSEPFQGRRRGRGVAHSHADTANDAEPDNQSGMAPHQTGDNAAEGKQKPAQGRPHLGAKLVLNTSSGNHHHGEQNHADGEGGSGLGIGQVRPAGIDAGHGLAGPVHIDQRLFPDTPGVENTEA